MPSINLPLISQTNFGTTTNYDKNVILTHSIPETFIKDEIFPFKGYITSPNPNGLTRVNVIFTRINDQRRLVFSQILNANEVNFKIYAILNMTGNFYISVFRGSMGSTFLATYTIEPRFIKSLLSQTPSAVRSASLNLIGNKLFVNWTHSSSVKPALTRLIFTQDDYLR